jgi:hypothetical protein
MFTVRIPWKDGDESSDWDQTCIWAIEQFGLPGKRYICKPTENHMDFNFNEEKDSILFALRWAR